LQESVYVSGSVVPRKLPSSVVFGRYLLETGCPGYVSFTGALCVLYQVESYFCIDLFWICASILLTMLSRRVGTLDPVPKRSDRNVETAMTDILLHTW